jgi:hypothetical protein
VPNVKELSSKAQTRPIICGLNAGIAEIAAYRAFRASKNQSEKNAKKIKKN